MRKFVIATTILIGVGLMFTACNREDNSLNKIRNAVNDVDGNSYDAVRVGNQVWMKTNLRTKHFQDGSPIINGDDLIIIGETIPADPVYTEPVTVEQLANLPDYNKDAYGLYYNWSAVADSRGLCPKGWHVPSVNEWKDLTKCVYNKYSDEVTKALASTNGWKESQYGGTPGFVPEKNNATGFSAIPSAVLWLAGENHAGEFAFFWTSSECVEIENHAYSCFSLCCYSDNVMHKTMPMQVLSRKI